jgi:hypothetical protein
MAAAGVAATQGPAAAAMAACNLVRQALACTEHTERVQAPSGQPESKLNHQTTAILADCSMLHAGGVLRTI